MLHRLSFFEVYHSFALISSTNNKKIAGISPFTIKSERKRIRRILYYQISFLFSDCSSCRSFLYHFREKRVWYPFLSPHIFVFFVKNLYPVYTRIRDKKRRDKKFLYFFRIGYYWKLISGNVWEYLIQWAGSECGLWISMLFVNADREYPHFFRGG